MEVKPDRIGLWFLACLTLASCAPPRPVVVQVLSKPVIETQTKTVVKVERIIVHPPDSDLTCPADPMLPFFPTPKQLGQYIADITEVADECRARLEVLRR